MRNLALLLCLSIAYFPLKSQQGKDEGLDLNLPEVPTSPAFILMGVSPTEIESPQTPSDLELSLQNASQNFTTLPQNYFIALTPFWLLNKKHVSFDEYSNKTGENIVQNIVQSLQVSFGVSDSVEDGTVDRRYGAGLNFSMIRGELQPEVVDYYDKLLNYNTAAQKLIDSLEKSDPIIIELQIKLRQTGDRISALTQMESNTSEQENEILRLNDELELILNAISAQQQTLAGDHLHALRIKIRDEKFTRIGFFLNIAGGVAWNQFSNSSELYRWGAWINPGYQSKYTNWTLVGRMMSHEQLNFIRENGIPDTNDLTTIDVGMKLDYNVTGKAVVSGEFVYRTIPNTLIDPGYRLVLNASYNISKDLMVNFTYGKDFDVFLTGDSKYLALVNFVFGVGQTRKFK